MGDVTRRIMQFLVPVSIEALGRNDLTERSIIPIYINPENFNIQETKIINENLTKGGYVIQYWGEELPVIQASGTTGSGGIEAINILRQVYRHEQIQYKAILDARSQELAAEAQEALNNTTTATTEAGIVDVLDTITGGGFSGIVDGVSSTIEAITNAALGITSNNPNKLDLIPSLAAFAISIDLYWQGEKFRGYFKSFSVEESSQNVGLFNYSFTFNVIKRSGERKNFMPWHRSPYDAAGQPTTASTPKEGARTDELSFSTNAPTSTVNSIFKPGQTPSKPIEEYDWVEVPINRRKDTSK